MDNNLTYDIFLNNMVVQYGLDFLKIDTLIKKYLYDRQIAYNKIVNTSHRDIFERESTFLCLFNTFKMN